ncbi:MAG: PepSY domain-containing protein, partial [archaeon]
NKRSLHVFLHEIGHSFGGLNEGYGMTFLGDAENGGIAYYKENYDKKAPAYNWDIEGCPKWCSGEINKGSACYPAYTILKDCLLSPQTNTSESANACSASFIGALENGLGMAQPFDCNFGNNCTDNTNCWYIGNGYFRAHANDIMFGGGGIGYEDFVSGNTLPTYGPAGEHIKEVIELLLKSISQRGQTPKPNIYSYSFHNEDNLIKGNIKFSLRTGSNEPFILLNDEVLNNAFFIKQVIDSKNESIINPIKKEDSNGDYNADISIYNPSKGPVKSVYISFISAVDGNAEWKYDLNLSDLSLAYYAPPQDLKKSADEYIISQVGQEYFDRYFEYLGDKPYPEDVPDSNSRILQYNHRIAVGDYNENIRITVWFNLRDGAWEIGNGYGTDAEGLPDCVSEKAKCMPFGVTQERAVEIARENGAFDGAEKYAAGIHYYYGDVQSYVWDITTFKSALNGKTAIIDLNSGKLISISDWQAEFAKAEYQDAVPLGADQKGYDQNKPSSSGELVSAEYAREKAAKLVVGIDFNGAEAGLVQFEGKPAYKVVGKKSGKIIFVLPIELDVTVLVDAQSGEVLKMEFPWWSFLVMS